MIILIVIAIPVAILFIRWVDPGYTREPYRRSEFLLDDRITIVAYGKNREMVEKAVDSAFQEIRRLERVFNRYDTQSELAEVNREAYHRAVEVSPDLFEVLDLSLEYYHITEGTFDITIGPLIDLWDILGRMQRGEGPPTEEEIDTAKARCGADKLILDSESRTVRFTMENMIIDLGGVAKGYCADRAVAMLREKGVERGFVDMVSTTVTLGEKPVKAGGPWWRMAISDPRKEGSSLGVLNFPGDVSASTSGDYQRYFEYEGIRYCHILDPASGRPANKGVISDTAVILAADSHGGARSDILSTAFFIMGYPKSLRWAEEHGIELLLVDSHEIVHHTPNLSEYLEISSEQD